MPDPGCLRPTCDCCGTAVQPECIPNIEFSSCNDYPGLCVPYCADGGVTADGDGGVADGSSDGASDGGGGSPGGTCTTDGDCPGGACIALAGGSGWRTCQLPVTGEATSCSGDPGPTPDDCCASSDCTGGSNGGCFGGPLFYCGGAFPGNANVCVYDECQADADCVAQSSGLRGLCVPGGTFGEKRAHCTYGDCRVDADCQSRSGGQCRPFVDPCSGRLEGFSCTYADSACRSDQDCTDISGGLPYCQPGTDGNTQCTDFTPPP
jgi:hypothetical protein